MFYVVVGFGVRSVTLFPVDPRDLEGRAPRQASGHPPGAAALPAPGCTPLGRKWPRKWLRKWLPVVVASAAAAAVVHLACTPRAPSDPTCYARGRTTLQQAGRPRLLHTCAGVHLGALSAPYAL